MSDEKVIVVEQQDDGQRLDRWLKRLMPFGLAQKLIRKGAVRVDGKKVKGDIKIYAGQKIRVPEIEDKPKIDKVITHDDVVFIKSLVIYDDGDIVAINKPSGLASQGGGDEKKHVDGLLEGLKNSAGLKPKLVHRLDKETSGVMVLARQPETIRAFGRLLKHKAIKKLYVAITMPAPERNEGTIRAPIGKTRGPIKDKMEIDEIDGKKAETDFIVLERAANQAALVGYRPRTGRTHQIRVHSSEILGAPILYDTKYGGVTVEDEELDLSKRLHLHAASISFEHPGKNNKITVINAPLPEELKKSWKAFGFDVNLTDNLLDIF
jgi:23S rRNA pseudouridine955/2504/2580 synthase